MGENVTYTGWITYCLISSKPLTEIGNLAFSLSEVPLHDCHYIEGLHLRSKVIKDYIDLVVFHFALLSVLELTPSSQKPPFTCFLGSSRPFLCVNFVASFSAFYISILLCQVNLIALILV